MRSWTKAAAALGALAAHAAEAQQPAYGPLTYDYLFANYALTELDNGGVEIGGSIEVADRVHVFGSYHDWELDGGADRSGFSIGGGYRWALSSTMDVIAKVAFAETEIDLPGPAPEFEDDGLIVSGELRSWVTERLELSGELLLDDSLGNDLETVLEFGAQHHLNPNLSVGGRLRIDDDDTTLLLGARFYFGGGLRR